MTSAVPFSRSREQRPAPSPGDAAYAPADLMEGPGRFWDTEARWAWVVIRIGGRWRPGRVSRWRLHQGSREWAAYIRWGAGPRDVDWYLYEPATVRRAPAPPGGRAPWEVPPGRRANSATVGHVDRLSEITFRLPDTPASRGFLGELRLLFDAVPYAAAVSGTAGGAGGRLVLAPPRPAGARPATAFEVADVRAPEVALGAGRSIGGDDPPRSSDLPDRIAMAELTRRLAGHVRRVDHTGVNLPTRTASPEEWRALTAGLASTSALYRYPTGEDWPFVLPATSGELVDGISEFVVGREPRFELVHDRWQTRTLWQFALGTDLTRAELEQLFPEPEGTAFPGLAEFFRVVPVRSPWPTGPDIRFDLYYRSEDGPSDWETGKWLVTEGGRLR